MFRAEFEGFSGGACSVRPWHSRFRPWDLGLTFYGLGFVQVAVPLEFAVKLSVPEAVTAFNASQLSQMIRNGPNKHPGALALQDDKGNT